MFSQGIGLVSPLTAVSAVAMRPNKFGNPIRCYVYKFEDHRHWVHRSLINKYQIRIVTVVLQQVAQHVHPLHHVPVRIEQVVLRRAVLLPADQFRPPQIPRCDVAQRADFRHDVLPVPQVDDARRVRAAPVGLAAAQPVRPVGIGRPLAVRVEDTIWLDPLWGC